MAIVAKWLTHRIVAPTLVGSIPISRPNFKQTMGYGQAVKASDFDSEIGSSNLPSPAIFIRPASSVGRAFDF